jgi:hypothetical protein
MKEDDPALAAVQARLDFLKAAQEDSTARAELLAQEKASKALKRNDPAFAAARDRARLLAEALAGKEAALAKAAAAAEAFHKLDGGEKAGEFIPWTDANENPPV